MTTRFILRGYPEDNMENVYIYVADGISWSYLPDSIGTRGPLIKTVAASLYSPPSFATLLTGLYPQQHGVYSWQNKLSENIKKITQIDGVNGGYTEDGTESRLFHTLGFNSSDTLKKISNQFVLVERDLETHYPYDKYTDNSEYFKKDWETIRAEYEDSIQRSANTFQDRLDTLERRGLLEDTLVIFTSDHGELLGEYGETLHVAPACPELVYVPTVFIHPKLSDSSFQIDATSDIIEHVDVVQTALSLLDGVKMRTMGTNIIRDERARPWGYNHANVRRKRVNLYTSDSLWWHDGGVSVLRNSRAGRALYYLYKLTRSVSSPKFRNHPIKTLSNYVWNEYTYGDIPVSSRIAKEKLNNFAATLNQIKPEVTDLDDETREHLRKMGYIT